MSTTNITFLLTILIVSKKIYKIVCDFSIFLKINSTLAIKMDVSHFEFYFLA